MVNNSDPQNVSIIVPTYKEGKNIAELIRRIANTPFQQRKFEVILVDDNSEDGIVETVSSLTPEFPWLKLMVRKQKKSLSLSVLEGIQQAQYPLLIIMDADLSHPPEKIPQMLDELTHSNTDMVIGSRYVQGGSTDEIWPWSRKLISHFSAAIARLLIFANVRDPLSGFIAIRKSTFNAGDQMQPVGWKISLEMILKCHCKNIKEVPIHFTQRRQGVSKMSVKVAYDYLLHVKRLAMYRLFGG